METPSDAPADLSSKVCSTCKLSKPIEEFNFRNRATGSRHRYCRECGKTFTRNHYRQNKRQYVERTLRSHAKRREFLHQTKSRPCTDCGIQYPYYVMDFDHREGEEKIFEMNRVSYVTMSALKREIEKRDVVCANCHRERTYQRIIARGSSKRATRDL